MKTSQQFSQGEILMKFNVPAGAEGLVMAHGQDGGESEIVLPQRGIYKINKVEQDTHGQKWFLHVTYLREKTDA